MREPARLGAHVAITGRAEGAAREIRASGGERVGRRCGVWPAEVLQRLPRLDGPVNNVGGYWHPRHLTADGRERPRSPRTPCTQAW